MPNFNNTLLLIIFVALLSRVHLISPKVRVYLTWLTEPIDVSVFVGFDSDRTLRLSATAVQLVRNGNTSCNSASRGCQDYEIFSHDDHLSEFVV